MEKLRRAGSVMADVFLILLLIGALALMLSCVVELSHAQEAASPRASVGLEVTPLDMSGSNVLALSRWGFPQDTKQRVKVSGYEAKLDVQLPVTDNLMLKVGLTRRVQNTKNFSEHDPINNVDVLETNTELSGTMYTGGVRWYF